MPVRQTSASTFTVGSRFRFRNPTVEDRIVGHLAKVGAFADDGERREAFRRAAGYGPANGPTDLASIPAFMRWLVNTYGDHSLAAVPVLVATLVLRGLDRAGRRFDRPLPPPPPVTPPPVTLATVAPPEATPAAVPATH